jgi:acyl carrier protein
VLPGNTVGLVVCDMGLGPWDLHRDVYRSMWEVIRLATVFERVRGIVAERLGVEEDKITMESEFIGDLNADSLDLVEVIMALEQEFDTEVKDEDAENIRTVGDAVNFIEEHGS